MGKVICKACGCENSSEDIFCRKCENLIMTSEYINNEPTKNVEAQVENLNNINATKPESKKDNNKKGKSNKKNIIIISAIATVLVIIGVVVFFFLNADPEDPTKKMIVFDLNKDTSITEIEVGKETLEFKVKSLDIISSEETEEKDKYIVEGSILRKADLYQVNSMNYTITYENRGGVYTYASATPNDGEEVTLSPLRGYPVDLAEKLVKEEYKGVEFDKQETDLEKGVDKIYFNIDNNEFEGSVFAHYKFDEKDGWIFKKINDKGLSFKPGITHQEEGLYTNTNIKNIMLFGIDAESNAGRSDCMMLISIDSNSEKLKQTSFMRDTYVSIPGSGANKLNAAYAIGGPQLAVSAIENTYGIKIDNYMAANFTTFKNIIDSIGGVTVNITDDEAGYINWQIGKNGQSGVGYVPSSGGSVRLNGQQALWLCRDRGGNGFSGNDFTRTSRQRKVVTSLIASYRNSSPTQILNTINNLKGYVYTDFTDKDFKWFAERSSKFLNYSVEERCVPDDGEWYASTSSAGAWIIAINDINYLKSDVQKYIYQDLK